MPKVGPYCKRHCQGFKDTGGRCFCDDCDHSNDYWEGYDDVEFDEDGDADECYGRYDRFLEMQDLDVENVDSAFKEICEEIKEKEWPFVD